MDYQKKLQGLIEILIAQGASDLHLGEGVTPVIRVSSRLTPLLSEATLTKEDMLGLTEALMTPEYKKRFLETREADFSYSHGESARFRGNGYFERGRVGIALRLVPRQIKTLSELNLPRALEVFAAREQGFFLVVGPVGQGKTTTIASLIERINNERAEHIVTIA